MTRSQRLSLRGAITLFDNGGFWAPWSAIVFMRRQGLIEKDFPRLTGLGKEQLGII